jgi:hypothetical protein
MILRSDILTGKVRFSLGTATARKLLLAGGL